MKKNWPTAAARDYKDTPGMSTAREGRAMGRIDQLPRAIFYYSQAVKGEAANCTWVESHMGLPSHATLLESNWL